VNPLVKELQQALLSRGYETGVVDGEYGPSTHRAALKAICGEPGGDNGQVHAPFNGEITEKIALEILSHEAIVPEAYKDSKGVWTWSVGITNASGHQVYPRYKDNPQSIQRCIEVYVWLLKTKYGPEVRGAFLGHKLTEAQFAAALSFHYNTGAIQRASWVDSWKAGDTHKAQIQIMEWRKPAEIIERREKERDLFFGGVWSADGKATVYQVAKPSYSPRWSSAKRIDISADLKAALEKA
jgi:lysozyme